MPDKKQDFTRGVPWADHTTPSSQGETNQADKTSRIDPEELDDRDVSPGQIAASSAASPHEDEGGDDIPQADGDDSREGYGERDVGNRSERAEKKPD